jgi:flagella basal body P-ring formation protein FlgA
VLVVLSSGEGTVWGREVGSTDLRVQAAIEDAVIERLGPGAVVTVTVTDVHLTDTAGTIVARLDQGMRAGVAGRVTLFSSDSRRVRVGEATAVIAASVQMARARRALARDEAIGLGDVENVREQVMGSLRRPVGVDDLVGGRTRRDVEPGALIDRADVAPEQAIRSGDSVRAVVRLGGVEVATTATALQSGARHEVIRLTNPTSRKALLGRVTKPGEVEVIDAN